MARARGVVVQINAEENTGRAFSAVNDQIAALKQQVTSLRAQMSQAGTSVESFGHGMQAQMTYASSAVREFEGQLPIRAVERFMTETLGLGPALAAAFPVVGAVAFGAIVVRDVASLIKAREAAAQLAGEIQKAFDQAIAKEREQADALAVSNDKLMESIAQLEKKPAQNGLAAGLDEAAAESDKLEASIHSAADAAEKLFAEKYKVGWFDKLTGTRGTDDVKDEVTSTLDQADALQNQYASVVQGARDSGNSKEHIDEINQMMLAHIQDLYAASTKKLEGQLKAALNAQADDRELGGDGSQFQARINALRGSLALYQEQQRVLGGQYLQSKLAPIQAQARGDKQPSSRDHGQAAEDAYNEAVRKAHEQAAQHLIAAAKLESDLELAQLDDKHKRGLVSEKQYYADRYAIQEKALDAEISAAKLKETALSSQITGLQKERSGEKDKTKQTQDDTKILNLQTQLNALTDQRLKTEEERQKVVIQAGQADYEATKKAADEAERLAAQLEGIRGGSAAARIAQVRDHYDDARKKLDPADRTGLSNLDTLENIDIAKVGVTDAERNYSLRSGEISAQRAGIDFDVRSGAISSDQAQQQRIALDREEAAAMQPVLEQYQKLAAAGDLSATAKVAELSEKIRELQNPISEAATQVRGQLNSAFEQLFANLGGGKKALASFAQSLEKIAITDSYKRLAQPLFERAFDAMIPGHSPAAGATPGGAASPSKGLLGTLLPWVARTPAMGVKGAIGRGTTVQIINQSSQPVQGTATTQDTSGMTDALRGPVLQIILEDAARGGSITQMLSSMAGKV